MADQKKRFLFLGRMENWTFDGDDGGSGTSDMSNNVVEDDFSKGSLDDGPGAISAFPDFSVVSPDVFVASSSGLTISSWQVW